jgi:putative salt-induced outer membrane protein
LRGLRYNAGLSVTAHGAPQRAAGRTRTMKQRSSTISTAISLIGFACAIATFATPASAKSATDPGWNTSAELGAISTSGNTVGTSVTSKVDAKQETNNWSNEYVLSAYFKDEEVTKDGGRKERERSAERYSLSAKAAFKLLEDGDKLFALGTHVDDKFGAYTRYSTLGVGYGTQWFKDEQKSVDVEIGPGYFSGERPSGDADNGFTVRGAAAVKWKLSDSALMSQTLSVERGTTNVHSMAETALRTKINSTMQMKAAFNVRNDTTVPEDKKNTDTQTSVTLVYSF